MECDKLDEGYELLSDEVVSAVTDEEESIFEQKPTIKHTETEVELI